MPPRTGDRPARADRSRRRRNPRGQGQRLRSDLIEAAAALITEAGGSSQLSMRSVAARVGVAATSVYLHFTDIGAIKVAVAEHGFKEFAAARDATLAGITDPATSLVTRCQAYANFALEHPAIYELMFGPDLAHLGTASRSTEGAAAFDALVGSIRSCQQAGAATTDDDPLWLAALVWPALHGHAKLRIDRPSFQLPPIDVAVADTVRRLVGLR